MHPRHPFEGGLHSNKRSQIGAQYTSREDIEIREFPGSVDGLWSRHVHDSGPRGVGTVRFPRLVPRDPDAPEQHNSRTLTNLYNQRPTWLDLAPRRLDEAVFAAYGWPPELSDDALLERILALNLDRSGR